MTKVSAPYLYRKRGIYYLQKCIPKDLVPHFEESNALSQCIAEIEKGKTDVEMMVSDANTAGEKHIDALEAKSEKFAKIHQQREDESVEKIGDLTEDFKKLAGKTYSNKSSDMIADE